MIKDILQIVPYISKHGKIILANQMNHVLMDKNAMFEGEAMELEQTGLAYTCLRYDCRTRSCNDRKTIRV
jgi:hypothetical protein